MADQNRELVLGIDAGGTFTDFVLLRNDGDRCQLTVHKVLSTPGAPEQAILQGIKELNLESPVNNSKLHIIHGSTVATNAALEGKGARTAFITNHGFGDMLTIGRQTRPSLYSLEIPPVKKPVDPELCLEVGGRLTADGEVLEPLTNKDIEQTVEHLKTLKPEAVAINLLFSFVDEWFEKELEQAINNATPTIFTSRSSEVLPEYREYERGIATWLNASLGPVVSRYLVKLKSELGDCPLAIMQSSGETLSASAAASHAVNLLLSGPAAGLTALNYLGEQLGESRFISFDMGGTSTDVALLDGDLIITNEGSIAGYPVAVPMVDMHTIGAGGGSIAFLDSGGMLQVGPESAGADPGPACYGRGGNQVTVTDANLVLGRIPESASLAGKFKLDRQAALRCIAPLSKAAGLDETDLALGIVQVANEHMAAALRMISVQRGYDPEDFVLTCFGGAGGLHVCALAEAMGMRRAIVPLNAGVLSALGMLVAPQGRQFSHTVRMKADKVQDTEIELAFSTLIEQGMLELESDGLLRDELQQESSIDICYAGQSSTLNIPWLGKTLTTERFHRLHNERYGFSLARELEFVNLRVRISGPQRKLDLLDSGNSDPVNKISRAEVFAEDNDVPVFKRAGMATGKAINGPAIITELSATTYLAEGWQASQDEFGNLRLERG
ncbi:MAG: hydantoinase/oxoprolinase family protein [Gammaproteobacteria bacterium]|nr:hydantoinase/oxoprolinase family protein [Gammaproteobacteria bacterium]